MSNPNNPSDYIQIRLTAAGIAFAGTDQTLRAANAHSQYTFVGAAPQKVLLRGEWTHFYARELTPSGQPIFEVVPGFVAEPAFVLAENAAANAQVNTAATATTVTTEATPHGV